MIVKHQTVINTHVDLSQLRMVVLAMIEQCYKATKNLRTIYAAGKEKLGKVNRVQKCQRTSIDSEESELRRHA